MSIFVCGQIEAGMWMRMVMLILTKKFPCADHAIMLS
jgi:hypothetical protein